MDKTQDGDKIRCKTIVLNVAKDNSYWDAKTVVLTGNKTHKAHIRVFSIRKLIEREKQLRS